MEDLKHKTNSLGLYPKLQYSTGYLSLNDFNARLVISVKSIHFKAKLPTKKKKL